MHVADRCFYSVVLSSVCVGRPLPVKPARRTTVQLKLHRSSGSCILFSEGLDVRRLPGLSQPFGLWSALMSLCACPPC